MVAQQTSAFLLSLLIATTALANSGPPRLQKGQKIIDPIVRFEGIDKHPSHVFYLNYGGFFLGSNLVEVKESEPITLKFKTDKTFASQASMSLLTLDRAEFEKRKKTDPSLKWLEERKDVIFFALPHLDRAVPDTVKEVPTTTYRVTLKDGKLSAAKVELKKSADAAPGFVPLWTLALAGSLSMAWFGVWAARRRNG